MNSQRSKELIPLALIAAALIYTGMVIMTTDTMLTLRFKIAYGLTAIALITHFLNRTISAIVLGITLVLGLLNVIAFTPMVYTVGAGLKFVAYNTEVALKIQLFSLFVFLTFIYAYGRTFKAWINKDGL
jgi:hypothetical protein